MKFTYKDRTLKATQEHINQIEYSCDVIREDSVDGANHGVLIMLLEQIGVTAGSGNCLRIGDEVLMAWEKARDEFENRRRK